MDDTKRLKASFPLGSGTVVVQEPTEGQILVLTLVHNPGQNRERGQRMVARVLSVVEALVGAEAWEAIEQRLIDGETSAKELMDFASAVFSFPWSQHRLPAEGGEVPPEPAGTERPEPRIVP